MSSGKEARWSEVHQIGRSTDDFGLVTGALETSTNGEMLDSISGNGKGCDSLTASTAATWECSLPV
jgi:hypothetical protein